MTYEHLQVQIDGPVATLTLNRPEKLNALGDQLRNELDAALRELNPGDAVRVIRVRGAGRAFCSGYDLSPLEYGSPAEAARSAPREGSGAADLGQSKFAVDRSILSDMAERWLRMWNYRKPIIAQVHGYCLAGGLDLLASCDIAIAGSGAVFGHPPARMHGLPVLMGMLPAKIGAARAKEFFFTGDRMTATEAERVGLVNRVVPDDELDAVTMAYCQRVALAPLDTLTVHKQAVNRWSEIMGVRTAAAQSADWDAMAHLAPAVAGFHERMQADGLRAALAWRDDPYDRP